MTSHNFKECLARGEQEADEPFWAAVYGQLFPGHVGLVKNDHKNAGQRLGIDRIVALSNGRTATVDEKMRDEHWPDVALEIRHQRNDKSTWDGWMESDLQPDYLAYAYRPSRVCHVFAWGLLRCAWAQHHAAWIDQAKAKRAGFRTFSAVNEGYRTTGICVPTETLIEAAGGKSFDLGGGR